MFYSLDDVLESWVGTADLSSRRFVQDFVENDKSYQPPVRDLPRLRVLPGARPGHETRPRRRSRWMMPRSSISCE